LQRQKVREHEAGRACADDGNLGIGSHTGIVVETVLKVSD
jgi:hypothetical protein